MTPKDPKDVPAYDDPSKYGGETTPGNMNPVEPSQDELDADIAANPDTSPDTSQEAGG